jgi:hypothetical protein
VSQAAGAPATTQRRLALRGLVTGHTTPIATLGR